MKDVRVADLKNHPVNIQLYGDQPDPKFVESIREHGIQEPLRITPGNVVISGHRRKQAARIVGLETVPCIVEEFEDESAEIRAIVLANVQRVKTPEQLAREAALLLKHAKAKAAERQEKTRKRGDSPVPPNSAERGREAITDVAEELQVGKTKLKESLAVVEQIDQAEQQGDTERAEELRDTLNNQSVHAAYRKVQGDKPDNVTDQFKKPVSDALVPAFEGRKRLASIEIQLAKIIKELEKMIEDEEPAVYWLSGKAVKALQQAKREVNYVKPHCVCTDCKGKVGKKCDYCEGSGFLLRKHLNSMLPEDRRWLEER